MFEDYKEQARLSKDDKAAIQELARHWEEKNVVWTEPNGKEVPIFDFVVRHAVRRGVPKAKKFCMKWNHPAGNGCNAPKDDLPVLDFYAYGTPLNNSGWLVGWLAGLFSGVLACWLAGLLPGLLAGLLACWQLACWQLACWPAGWLAGWLAGWPGWLAACWLACWLAG